MNRVYELDALVLVGAADSRGCARVVVTLNETEYVFESVRTPWTHRFTTRGPGTIRLNACRTCVACNPCGGPGGVGVTVTINGVEDNLYASTGDCRGNTWTFP